MGFRDLLAEVDRRANMEEIQCLKQEKQEILAALKSLLDNHTCSRWDSYVSEERTGCVCSWCEAFRVWDKYKEEK